MALKAIIEKLDDVAEGVRSEYRAGTKEEGLEGRFVLAVDTVGGFALENVEGLKSALGKERTTVRNLTAAAEAFKDMDPAKAREALAKFDEFSKLDPEKEADKIAQTKLDGLKAQLVEKHTGELTARDTRIQGLTSVVDSLVREQAATAAIAAAKGSVELLLPHVLKQTRTVEKDGNFSVEVIDASGNIRIGDGQGSPMDLAGLVGELRKSDVFARAFEGEGHSGSGAPPPGGGGGATRGKLDGNTAERGAYFASKYGLPG